MHARNKNSLYCLAAVAALFVLGAAPAAADKPSWAGEGKHKEKKERVERSDSRSPAGTYPKFATPHIFLFTLSYLRA